MGNLVRIISSPYGMSLWVDLYPFLPPVWGVSNCAFPPPSTWHLPIFLALDLVPQVDGLAAKPGLSFSGLGDALGGGGVVVEVMQSLLQTSNLTFRS